MVIRCWLCGVEPTGAAEVTALGEPEPRYIPTGWPPATDHEHSEITPTPGSLIADGARAFDRFIESWS